MRIAKMLKDRVSSTQVQRWLRGKGAIATSTPATEYDLRQAVEAKVAHDPGYAKQANAFKVALASASAQPSPQAHFAPLTKETVAAALSTRRAYQGKALEEVLAQWSEKAGHDVFGFEGDTYQRTIELGRRFNSEALGMEALVIGSRGVKIRYTADNGRQTMREPGPADYEAFSSKVSWNQVNHRLKQAFHGEKASFDGGLTEDMLKSDIATLRAYAQQNPSASVRIERQIAGWHAGIAEDQAANARLWAPPTRSSFGASGGSKGSYSSGGGGSSSREKVLAVAATVRDVSAVALGASVLADIVSGR